MLAVIVQGSGADTLHFSARQRWLRFGGIYRAFSGAGANHSMELIDKENAVAGSFNFINYLL